MANTENSDNQLHVEKTMRGLMIVWAEFESRLERVPIVEKLNRETLEVEDYRALLRSLRQQVVDGASWIASAASNIGPDHLEMRSRFLQHAIAEHRDFRMLEDNFVSIGGDLKDIQTAEKNIGSEALSAYMFHRASQPDPFDMLGAMFIIEGLGVHKAREWGIAIRDQLELKDEQVGFFIYHGENDEDHLAEFERSIGDVIQNDDDSARIVKTARIVGKLYLWQLEEIERA